MLLGAGADVSAKDGDGLTAYEWARAITLDDTARHGALGLTHQLHDALGRKDRDGNSYLSFFFQPKSA